MGGGSTEARCAFVQTTKCRTCSSSSASSNSGLIHTHATPIIAAQAKAILSVFVIASNDGIR